MRMGFGFGTYMLGMIGTFGQITTIGPRVENENGRAFAPAHLPVTLPLLITSYDSARLSSFGVARLQSVRLRASRRLQGLNIFRITSRVPVRSLAHACQIVVRSCHWVFDLRLVQISLVSVAFTEWATLQPRPNV